MSASNAHDVTLEGDQSTQVQMSHLKANKASKLSQSSDEERAKKQQNDDGGDV